MMKAPSSLQDLRPGLYGMRKAERAQLWAKSSVGRGGVVDGGSGHPDRGVGSRAVNESGSDRIGHINRAAKCAGARSEGNPHAACEVAGAGNGVTDTATRARRGKPRIQPSQVLTGHRASSRPYRRAGGEETCPWESDCGPAAKAPDEPPNPTGYAPPLDSTTNLAMTP